MRARPRRAAPRAVPDPRVFGAMEIHKPGPFHGWRERLKEVGGSPSIGLRLNASSAEALAKMAAFFGDKLGEP